MNLSKLFTIYPKIGEHILFQLDLRSIIKSSLVCASFRLIIVSPSFMMRVLRLFRFDEKIIRQWKRISNNNSIMVDSITLALNMRNHLFFVLRHTSSTAMHDFARSCSVIGILFKNKCQHLLEIALQTSDDLFETQYLSALLGDLEINNDDAYVAERCDITRYSELWPVCCTYVCASRQ